jgi:hypothetical protein
MMAISLALPHAGRGGELALLQHYYVPVSTQPILLFRNV